MEERKIEIVIGDKKREVYAGNASLRRYRKAGGSMQDLESLDTEGNNSFDELMDVFESLALLLHSNLVDPEGVTLDDIINSFASPTLLFEKTEELIAGVPWLKNGAAAGIETK